MELPKLFCETGTNVLLKKKIEFYLNEIEIVYDSGTLFQIIDIVGYGYDLIPLNHIHKHQIRLLNSEMPNYFDVVGR